MDTGAEKIDRRLALQTVAVLLLLTLAGYGLTYFGSIDGAHGVFDRDSRFHSAANLPLSILVAMVLVGLLGIIQRGWLRRVVIVVEAGWLAAMFAFSVSHQDDFAAEADRQRLIVTQMAIDHPVMDPYATFIIQVPYVDIRHRPSIDYADGHSYFALLGDLFNFNDGVAQRSGPTIRVSIGDGWQKALTPSADGLLDWPAGTWPPDALHVGHIWCYEFTTEGKLQPRQSPIMIGGRNILHEGPDDAEGAVDLDRLQRWPLFDQVMGPDAAIFDAVLARRNSAPDAVRGLSGMH
jgi:hypothetical protein